MNSSRSLASMAALLLSVSCIVPSAAAAGKVDPSGTWTWVRELEGQQAQSVLTLSYKDGKISGSYKRQGHVVPISKAKFDKNEISFDAEGKWNDQKVLGKFKGKLSRDEINGSVEIVVEDGSLPLAWVARRGVDVDDLVGTWKLKLCTPNGNTVEPRLTLAAQDGSLKGTYESSRFGKHEAKEIKLRGSELSWTLEFDHDGQTFKGLYKGKLAAGKGAIKGTLALDSAGKASTLEFTGERIAPKIESGKKEHGKVSRANGRPAEPKTTDQVPAKRRVIVMLKSRQEILVVYSSLEKGQGPVFSIRSIQGKAIAHEISLKHLQANYPEIYKQYRTSFANMSADSLQRPLGKSPISASRQRLSSVILYPGVDFGGR